MQHDYDFLIVGSGFGGSVSAYRLSQKGYRVCVLEKGRRWNTSDFPESNWKLRRWLWWPLMGFRGFFKITLLRHVGILSGVGVGGGSLTYANTLPRPKDAFFHTGSWKGMADWKEELEPHYKEAEHMLGACPYPASYDSDETLKELASQMGKSSTFEPTRVAVYFGAPEEEVPDPFFMGRGPRRSGCNFCGACMTGCRYNAKNTLDKNYLYLAEKEGASVLERKKVLRVEALGKGDGSEGYRILYRDSEGLFRRHRSFSSESVIMSGGVLGTVRLLLNMKNKHLKHLSSRLGHGIRTNNESLSLIHSRRKNTDFSKGVAIGSIFAPDDHSHVESVRYGSGSGFWKLMGVPLVQGKNVAERSLKLIWKLISRPRDVFRSLTSKDFAKESVILLFMQHLESTLKFKKGFLSMRSNLSTGPAPTADMPLARRLTKATAKEIDGTPFIMFTEAVLGTPLTAHILGGCGMGKDARKGVLDANQRVHGYANLYVCDGSAISANPGVNPALTITAMTERVMSKIPENKKVTK